MIWNNPEFIKNIWLEISLPRLITMPLTLIAVFFAIWLGSDNYNFIEISRYVSILISGLFIIIWGSRLAYDSIIREFNERTWDSQRMTSISPWDMTVGKLFGTTIYSWYCGCFCMLAYAVINLLNLYLSETAVTDIKIFLIIIFAGIFAHALSICFSLTEIKKNRNREKISGSSYFLIIIFLFFVFVIGINFIGQIRRLYIYGNPLIQWYGFEFTDINFILFSVILFLILAVTGVYRNMRIELQMTNGPWIWVLFLIIFMMYASGLIANADIRNLGSYITASFYLSYGISIAAVYLMAFSEPKDIVDFRILLDKFEKKEWDRIGIHFPAWFISLIISVIICTMILAVSWIDTEVSPEISIMPGLYALNLAGFVLRDISLLIYINLTSKPDRADIAALIYLLILYLLVPCILVLSDIKILLPVFVPMFESSIINGTLPVFVPMFESSIINGTLPVFIQFIFICYLIYGQWKKFVMRLKIDKINAELLSHI